MRRVIALLLAWTAAFVSSPVRGAEIEVVTEGEKLVSQPSLSAETVFSVAAGDRLTALEWGESWVKVASPPGASYWVYGELVRDGVVAVSKLGIRSGPGITHPSIGSLRKGDVVEPLGTEGEWLRIAPPAGTGLWIRREAVRERGAPGLAVARAERPEPSPVETLPSPPPSAPPAAVPVVAPAPAPASEPVIRSTPVSTSPPARPVSRPVVTKSRSASASPPPSRPVVRTVTPAPSHTPDAPPKVSPPARGQSRPARPDVLSGVPLVRGRDQGASVTYQGVIAHIGPVWRCPSSYALLRRDAHGRAVRVCYVIGNPSKLRSLTGSMVTMDGAEYWIEGVRCPVVVPDRLVLNR